MLEALRYSSEGEFLGCKEEKLQIRIMDKGEKRRSRSGKRRNNGRQGLKASSSGVDTECIGTAKTSEHVGSERNGTWCKGGFPLQLPKVRDRSRSSGIEVEVPESKSKCWRMWEL